MAGLDAFLSSFIEECVDLGLKIFLLSLQSAHLHLDRLALVSLIEFDAAGRRRRFTLTEFLQVNELLVNIGDLPLQLLQLLTNRRDVLRVCRLGRRRLRLVLRVADSGNRATRAGDILVGPDFLGLFRFDRRRGILR